MNLKLKGDFKYATKEGRVLFSATHDGEYSRVEILMENVDIASLLEVIMVNKTSGHFTNNEISDVVIKDVLGVSRVVEIYTEDKLLEEIGEGYVRQWLESHK